MRPDIELAERAAREGDETEWRTPVGVVGALVAYVLLLEPLGYVVATALFFPVVARLLGSRSPCATSSSASGLALLLFVRLHASSSASTCPPGLTPIT